MTVEKQWARPGVGNSFWIAGHIGNKNGLCGQVEVLYGPKWFEFWDKMGL